MCLRLLWADDTKGALQVFYQQPGALDRTLDSCGGIPDEATEQGIWINADPVKGCLVCNVGESACSKNIARRGEGWRVD